MKKISSEDARRVNMISLIICVAAAVIMALTMALPFYNFSTTVFAKKSANTFVGDEKYTAARAEAEKAVVEYESRNLPGRLVINENVTLRENSKGVTTSLITFNVDSITTCEGYDFLGCKLPSSGILFASLALTLAGGILSALSLYGVTAKSARELGKAREASRGIACWLCLIGVLLVPVFAMNNNFIIERRILPSLASGGNEMADRLQGLLYGANIGDEMDAVMGSLTYSTKPWLWILGLAEICMLAGCVLALKGALGRAAARGGLYLFVVVLSVVILYPYYVMLITAFRSNAETTDMYFTNLFPTKWVWTNISDIANRGVFRFLLNSLALSGGATCIAMLCGIPAAYAMARMNFKGKKAFLGFIIMSQMFAPVVLLVGISRLMNTLRLNDTIVGLMFINAAFNQAFAIWLLRGTFVSISSEMEQAACIDGCSTFGALARVLLPMAAPGIVTTLIFVFINAWNEYTISTVLIATPDKKPITVGITQFSSFNMIEWQYLFASALIATIPVIIMFMFIEKHLVSGLTSGGVKG